MNTAEFTPDLLKLDCAAEAERIAQALRRQVREQCHRQGLVVALSGGVDSSVVGALCVKALGKERVFGLLMPERDSSEDTLALSRLIVEHLDIRVAEEDITPILEALGCYSHRDEAVRTVVPEYGPGYTCKIVLPGVLAGASYRLFSVVVRSPDGETKKMRLTPEAYLGIMASTNFKQRTRKTLEYYHADRLNYAVTGTPNRLEYDQGFFVKQGDGAADVKPIAHLYKTQVYALAESMGVPAEITTRPPTTDTYSMPQTQDEFYFALPYAEMDLCLYGLNHGFTPEQVAPSVGLTPEQVERVYRDIEAKRRTTAHLHRSPLLIDPVTELGEAR